MDLIIRNGTIVTEREMFKADLGVKDGKIAVIAGDLSDLPCENVVDATGKLVLPGAIDAHTHLAFPFGGTVSSDDFFAGTRAAACGGTTTESKAPETGAPAASAPAGTEDVTIELWTYPVGSWGGENAKAEEVVAKFNEVYPN